MEPWRTKLMRWQNCALITGVGLMVGCSNTPKIEVNRLPFGLGTETVNLPDGTTLHQVLDTLAKIGILPTNPDGGVQVTAGVAKCALELQAKVSFPTTATISLPLPETCQALTSTETNSLYIGAVVLAVGAVGILAILKQMGAHPQPEDNRMFIRAMVGQMDKITGGLTDEVTLQLIGGPTGVSFQDAETLIAELLERGVRTGRWSQTEAWSVAEQIGNHIKKSPNPAETIAQLFREIQARATGTDTITNYR